MSTYAPAVPQHPVQPNLARNIGIIIFVFIVCLLGGLYLSNISEGGNILSSPHSTNIVNGMITINAGSYNYYEFTLPQGATNVQLQGNFYAAGGSGNDIDVVVMNPTSFINWKNGHTVNCYYSSGQLTTSTFNVNLPSDAGTYYLVYSNTFSLFSQKNVNTQVNLNYYS